MKARPTPGAAALAHARLVLVDWHDAYGVTPRASVSWLDHDDVSDVAVPVCVRSVGWVLADTPQSLTLCSTHHGDSRPTQRASDAPAKDGDRMSAVLTIPRGCIQRITRLRER